MITLTLLHPIQSTPVQSWTFEHEPVIRIGRSTDNHVILYSAVVSRHHVELRQLDGQNWEILSLGANGTYLDGKQISRVPITDGVVIRLARSGPNIQIHLGLSTTREGANEKLTGLKSRPQPTVPSPEKVLDDGIAPSTTTNPRKTETEIDVENPVAENVVVPSVPQRSTLIEREASRPLKETAPAMETGEGVVKCSHARAAEDMAFCPDCGQPLKVLQVIGDYQVVKTLARDRLGVTQLIWREGQTLVLKALNPGVDQTGEVQRLFEQRALALLALDHPAIPHFVDYFLNEGRSCLVIEKVYGQDLHQWVVKHDVLSEATAIALMLQVCEALAYLHQQSPPVLHLDLRPENLICRSVPLVGAESANFAYSQLILTGFVSLQTLKMDTQSAVVGYQAPEQQQGHASPASDLFAIGPTLVYLLTGKEPAQFYAHREQGFRFYPEYVPGLSPALIGVVRRLTSPNPEDRYANALEVAEALSQVVSVERSGVERL